MGVVMGEEKGWLQLKVCKPIAQGGSSRKHKFRWAKRGIWVSEDLGDCESAKILFMSIRKVKWEKKNSTSRFSRNKRQDSTKFSKDKQQLVGSGRNENVKLYLVNKSNQFLA